MYKCGICSAKFNDHTAFSKHILGTHGGNGRVNWNSVKLAALAAVIVVASIAVQPVKAQGSPQSGGKAKPGVSWCPHCNGST